MSKKGYNNRQHQNNRIQIKRYNKWNGQLGDLKHLKMFKKTHFGCGCKMCKPWKHYGDNKNGEPKFKHSEMKRLID